MAKTRTVSNHLKSRLVTGTLIIWGLAICAIGLISIEYFSTRHSVWLVAVIALVVTCVLSLLLLISGLSVLQCLETLELWIVDAARTEVVQPVPNLPFLNKSTEPIFRACNALAARLKVDSYRRFQFVDRLAHDMRSSLASIQGYAEVLEDYNAGIEGASLQTYARIITNQTYRLVKMVDDTQTAACISEDRLSLEFKPVRPAVLLPVIIAEARTKNVREISYQDDMKDCLIQGDPYRLREMVSKLIEIAVSFSKSSVSIHALIEDEQAGSWVKIQVEDHGNGLSKPELTALIHPFEVGMDHITSPIFCHSMSFYIMKAIVDGHKGRLDVQSQPGQGTTYTILLPVQELNQ
jgi:signal transduction histidine kinase